MIKLDDKGLVPAIVQDADTGRVLTLAYMNQESLERTRASGRCGSTAGAARSYGTRVRLRATT